MDDYLRINRANWDERAPAHAASPGYSVRQLIDDPAFLSPVVRFDQPRLGDIRGLNAIHLQCHIGTDTVSLARLGARITGLDFSPASLAEARTLANRTGAPIHFVESDVYDALGVLEAASFDLVYTGVGALCWLPDIARWANVVSALLKPGGRLFIRDCHPMLFTIDDAEVDRVVVRYPYFQTIAPVAIESPGTYVETDASFTANLTHEWNHGIGEIVTALIQAGMELTALEEHDSVPWDALPGQMVEYIPNEWRLIDRPERLAASFTLQARKH